MGHQSDDLPITQDDHEAKAHGWKKKRSWNKRKRSKNNINNGKINMN